MGCRRKALVLAEVSNKMFALVVAMGVSEPVREFAALLIRAREKNVRNCAGLQSRFRFKENQERLGGEEGEETSGRGFSLWFLRLFILL